MNPIKVEIRPASKSYPMHTVIVFEYKFDTIRQESYWVKRDLRTYRLRSDAETFAGRFGEYTVGATLLLQ